MTALIETLYLSGRNLYVIIHFAGQLWNKDTASFENYNQGNWSHYAVPLAEQTSSGYYSASYPADIPSGTLSTECLYQQNGGTPTLPALPGGDSFLDSFQSQGTNAQTISGNGDSAANLAASALCIVPAVVVSGTLTAGQFSTTLANSIDNAYVGRIAVFSSGVLIGQASVITAYSHTGGKLSVAQPFTDAPSATDTLVIL